MKLYTADQMRELDRQTIRELGLPGAVLMENAGRAVVAALLERYASLRPGPVAVLAGRGNNGGDGFVVARVLRDRGWQVETLVLGRAREVRGDARIHLRALQRHGAPLRFVASPEALSRELNRLAGARLWVDALLGTGLASEVQGLQRAAIDWLNRHSVPVIAVDLPSGVEASSGRILGAAVRADLTVSLAGLKPGLVSYPGAAQAGSVVVAEIGIPAAALRQSPCAGVYVDGPLAAGWLPERPEEGHKGLFGHLLLVAGSRGKSGAAVLAARGALRSGAGLVTLAGAQTLQPVFMSHLVEAMTEPLPEIDGVLGLQALDPILALAAGKQGLALGPGLGQHPETQALVRRLLRDCPLPLVLDADGLNALAGRLELVAERPGQPVVLTPHPGELARLLDTSVSAIAADRLTAVREAARRSQAVCVLKGARTLTALADGSVFVNGSGNSGLASGGTGDVLTGLLGGLLAQGLAPERAAPLGVFLHGLAADRLAARQGNVGLTAGELADQLPAARQGLIASTKGDSAC